MIIDTLNNLEKYVALNPLFRDVVDYIRSNDLNSKPEGKEIIKGNDLFVNFNTVDGKSKEVAKLETHDKMIDIQIPLNVAEVYGYTPRQDLPALAYNNEKDITFYDGLAQQYVKAEPGMFAIFFPQDGHAPCISDEKVIKKVIFKVKA